jgi:hypothetical protein
MTRPVGIFGRVTPDAWSATAIRGAVRVTPGATITSVINTLPNEHPTLYAATADVVAALSTLKGELEPATGGAVWMHHYDFADRTEQLARHLRATITLADAGLFPSALALSRTALEHHLLDRLLLLADRYEEVIRPADETQIDQWEREWATKEADWTRDVVSIRRVRSGKALELVRIGHKVVDQAGNVTERISPYWVALERYDAFAGHPDLQACLTRPFRSIDDLEGWARRNQALYGAFLRWSSICWNLQLSKLASVSDLIQLQVHYSFLSAFTHATSSGYEAQARVRPPGPSADHVLGELALLYAVVISASEIAAWQRYIEQRPELLAPLNARIAKLAENHRTSAHTSGSSAAGLSNTTLVRRRIVERTLNSERAAVRRLLPRSSHHRTLGTTRTL